MTLKELQTAFDNRIGLPSTLIVEYDDEAELRYTSPTGITLFSLYCTRNARGDGWVFMSLTSVLTQDLHNLYKIGR